MRLSELKTAWVGKYVTMLQGRSGVAFSGGTFSPGDVGLVKDVIKNVCLENSWILIVENGGRQFGAFLSQVVEVSL